MKTTFNLLAVPRIINFFVLNFLTDAKSNGFRTIRRKEDKKSGEYEEAEEEREHKNKISMEYEEDKQNTHKNQNEEEDENDEED